MMTEALQKALRVIIEVANPDKVILFGSRVRGDDNADSDYDILVLKKGVRHTRKLAQSIYRNFVNIGAPIDILVYYSDKYEEMKNYPYKIYYEISRNGLLIYDKAARH